MKNKFSHVGVLMGGFSKEREVSLNTGRACSEALKKANYNVSEIIVDKNLIDKLMDLKPDVCFNALHGSYGEDGNIQGLLNTLRIPYTHSGVTASSIAMNKLYTKNIISDITKNNSKPIIFPKNLIFKNPNDYKQFFPIVIKPISGGSSVDIQIIYDFEKFKSLLPVLLKNKILIEPFVGDKELTVTVLKNKPLTVTEIIPKKNNKYYNYDSKYSKNASLHEIPANIPKTIFNQAMEWAKEAHIMLGCSGISRTDYRYDSLNEKLYMLEINTQPGMTKTSLAPEQAKFLNIEMSELVDLLIKEAKWEQL